MAEHLSACDNCVTGCGHTVGSCSYCRTYYCRGCMENVPKTVCLTCGDPLDRTCEVCGGESYATEGVTIADVYTCPSCLDRTCECCHLAKSAARCLFCSDECCGQCLDHDGVCENCAVSAPVADESN